MLCFKLTFHYSAIKPIIKDEEKAKLIALTFHYGAIKPQLLGGTLKACLN